MSARPALQQVQGGVQHHPARPHPRPHLPKCGTYYRQLGCLPLIATEHDEQEVKESQDGGQEREKTVDFCPALLGED